MLQARGNREEEECLLDVRKKVFNVRTIKCCCYLPREVVVVESSWLEDSAKFKALLSEGASASDLSFQPVLVYVSKFLIFFSLIICILAADR